MMQNIARLFAFVDTQIKVIQDYSFESNGAVTPWDNADDAENLWDVTDCKRKGFW